MTSMRSYLPDGVLDAFVAEYLHFGGSAELDGRDDDASRRLAPHRNAKMVYEHRFLGHRLIAKVYDEVEDGRAAYDVWHTLWTGGFGPGSVHRVPEPLIYLPEHRTLLIEPATGDCLLPLVLRDLQACETGMHSAARWLAELHTSPVRAGPPDNPARILYRLANRLVRTIAHDPALADTILSLLTELAKRGDALAADGEPPVAQTHGRFHCGHVFVAPGAVTVIDVDRAAPADPAKDIAEFLSRFRIEARKEAVKRKLWHDIGAMGTRIFVAEYQRVTPLRPPNLLYYWSATLLTLILDSAVKRHLDDETRRTRLMSYESEFRDLPRIIAGFERTA